MALLSLSRQQLQAFTRLIYNTLSSRGPIEVRTLSYQTVSRARIRTTMSTEYFIIVTDLVQNTSGRVQHFINCFDKKLTFSRLLQAEAANSIVILQIR